MRDCCCIQIPSPSRSTRQDSSRLLCVRREHRSKRLRSRTRCSYDRGKAWPCSTSSRSSASTALRQTRRLTDDRHGLCRFRHQADISSHTSLNVPPVLAFLCRNSSRTDMYRGSCNGTPLGNRSDTMSQLSFLRTAGTLSSLTLSS